MIYASLMQHFRLIIRFWAGNSFLLFQVLSCVLEVVCLYFVFIYIWTFMISSNQTYIFSTNNVRIKLIIYEGVIKIKLTFYFFLCKRYWENKIELRASYAKINSLNQVINLLQITFLLDVEFMSQKRKEQKQKVFSLLRKEI